MNPDCLFDDQQHKDLLSGQCQCFLDTIDAISYVLALTSLMAREAK